MIKQEKCYFRGAMMHKQIVLFSVARSGSTFVEVALKNYFKQYGGYRYISEYFNLSLPLKQSSEGFYVDDTFWHSRPEIISMSQEEMLRLKLERFEKLKATAGERYFLKVFKNQLPRGELVKLLLDSELILSYRENLWEHYLSYMISAHTGQYYKADGINWEPGTLIAGKINFLKFVSEHNTYKWIKQTLPVRAEISFEKLLQGPRSEYMRGMGFTEAFNWDQVTYPSRQNRCPKEEAFKNFTEMRDWFQEIFRDTASR